MSRRWIKPLRRLGLIGVVALLISCAATPSVFSPPDAPLNTVSFAPLTSDAELVNPMRGLYRWRNQQIVPVESYDSYSRYRWRDLEPRPGVYDFSVIEADLAKAEAAGRKHGFRVRAMIQDEVDVVPPHIAAAMELAWQEGETYIPDWNDPEFMAGATALITALGAQFNNDPRVSFLDIGMFGNWGEWHMWPFKYPAPTGAVTMSVENRRALIDAYLAAFPNKLLVMMTEDEDSLIYALKQSPQVGWRRDSLGSWIFDGNAAAEKLRNRPEDFALFQERWKTAPVITEFINPSEQRDPESFVMALQQVQRFHISMVGNGNMLEWETLSPQSQRVLGEIGQAAGYRLQLAECTFPAYAMLNREWTFVSRWHNLGNAPTYEDWHVALELRDPTSGVVASTLPLSIELRSLLPGDYVFTDVLRLPPELSPGSYELRLIVRDPLNYRQPLQLANDRRSEDGGYDLGVLEVRP